MAILETFTLLFEADASRVSEGLNTAERSTEDLRQQGESTDDVFRSLGSSFNDLISTAQGALTGVLSVAAISTAVIAQALKTDEIGRFSKAYGLAVEDVDAWGKAVESSGGSAEAFRGSVGGLNDSLTEMSLTGGGPAVEVFARLGINAVDAGGKVKNAFDVLPELAASFENLSAAEAVGLGQKLGLDQGTISLLQQGRVAVDDQIRRQKELGVVTEADAEQARKFNEAWTQTQQVFGSLSREVGIALLPSFTSILGGVESVVQFLRDNKELVIGFFIGASVAITAFYITAIKAAAIATLAAIAPFLAIGAAILAVGAIVGLLVDEFYALFTGGDSLIGLIGTKLVKAFNDFIAPAKKAFDTVKGFFGFGDDEGTGKTLTAVKKAEMAITSADNNPAAAQGANQIQATSNLINKNTSLSVGAVNVDARGGDSQQIAAGVSSALNDQMKQTLSNYDDGVLM